MVVRTFRKFLFIQLVSFFWLFGCDIAVKKPTAPDSEVERNFGSEPERGGEPAVEVVETDQANEDDVERVDIGSPGLAMDVEQNADSQASGERRGEQDADSELWGENHFEEHNGTVVGGPAIDILDPNVSEASYFSSGDVDGILTYMIGLYQTHGRHGFNDHPMGEALVFVGAQDGPTELILSSYEPVEWRLDGPGVAGIERLVLLGYHEQTVSLTHSAPALRVVPEKYTNDVYPETYFPDGVPLVHEWIELLPDDTCRGWDDLERPMDPEDIEYLDLVCEHRALEHFLLVASLHSVDAFAGAYEATNMHIRHTAEDDRYVKPDLVSSSAE